MLAATNSIGLKGIETYKVDVQVDLSKGLPAFDIVGLAGTTVKESRERVRAAIKNSGINFPPMRITCNLAPADVKKDSSIYDLPISIGILSAIGEIRCNDLNEYIILGELSLDGKINRVNGTLPMVIGAKALGYKKVILPFDNANEARFIDGIDVYPCGDLTEVMGFLNGTKLINPLKMIAFSEVRKAGINGVDFCHIKGQQSAKRALEIAAAGNHNVMFIGPAGSGKTMLARSMPSILPDMNFEEALEVTKIHSISGELGSVGIICERPFRAPHHGVSAAALIGGGSSARPGEISLAHNGVLFLDEFPEFQRQTIESLRQPLEDGFVTVSRVSATCRYPSSFMLIVSMNPCPCGNYGSDKECRCSEIQRNRYLNKISGPLLDRLDIVVEMAGIAYKDIESKNKAETSQDVRKRVNKARIVQYKRNGGNKANGMMNAQDIEKHIFLDGETKKLLEVAFERLGLSARAYHRILKVSRTIADLSGSEDIKKEHIMEALSYRGAEIKYWQ